MFRYGPKKDVPAVWGPKRATKAAFKVNSKAAGIRANEIPTSDSAQIRDVLSRHSRGRAREWRREGHDRRGFRDKLFAV
jgi:hypothetical protein